MLKFLVLLTPLVALAASPVKQSLKVKSGVHIDYVDGLDIRSRIFGYRLNFDYADKFAEDVALFFSASVFLETGSNEVVADNTEFAPLEAVILNEGGFNYNPVELLGFKFGALSPREYNSPLLITGAPVVGAQELIDFEFLYFKALQAIPNNNRLARRTGTLDNGTPSFYLETLGFKWRDYLKVEISHFLFKDLAPNIANQSRQFGNSVSGTGQEASRFNYGFSGYNGYLEGNLLLGGKQLTVYGEYLVNDEAPVNRNEGYLGGLKLQFSSFGLGWESFRNETDTSPGFYNSKYYGHNNNSGNAISFFRQGKDIEFLIKYYQLNPIEDNANQFKTDILVFNFLTPFYW